MPALFFDKALTDVAAFQKMVGRTSPEQFINPDTKLFDNRFDLLVEQVGKLKPAGINHNTIRIVDSALDISYVALSIIDEFGMSSKTHEYHAESLALEEYPTSWTDTWYQMTGMAAAALAAHRYVSVWVNTFGGTQYAPDKMLVALYNLALVPTLFGTVVPWMKCWAALHEANMRKHNPDGTVFHNAADKVMKPEGWKSPRESMIAAFIEKKVPFIA